jgi:hypothetical protein
MAQLSDMPIKSYELGMPVMLGEVVGRIIGESEKGSRGIINDVEMPSIIKISTPHGSVLETGIFYVSEIDDEGMDKLRAFEKDCREKKQELYTGVLKEFNEGEV